MATRRESNRHSMGCRSRWQAGRSSVSHQGSSGGIPGRSGWRLVQPFAISFSSTIPGLSNPFESRMVKAFASSLATRVPSAFEVLFPTTTMVSISASPTTAIVPGSSTRPNKRCSANQYRVSRRRAGAWLANCDMPTESGHRSESRSRSTTSVTMPF